MSQSIEIALGNRGVNFVKKLQYSNLPFSILKYQRITKLFKNALKIHSGIFWLGFDVM